MNLTKTLLVIAASTLSFAACKKEKDAPAPAASNPTIVGYWTGKYGNTTAYPNNGYAFLFRSNGTVRVYNSTDTAGAGKAEGTYSISGSIIKTTYQYIGTASQYSTTASIDSHFTFIEGTWGIGANDNNGGKFFANKQ